MFGLQLVCLFIKMCIKMYPISLWVWCRTWWCVDRICFIVGACFLIWYTGYTVIYSLKDSVPRYLIYKWITLWKTRKPNLLFVKDLILKTYPRNKKKTEELIETGFRIKGRSQSLITFTPVKVSQYQENLEIQQSPLPHPHPLSGEGMMKGGNAEFRNMCSNLVSYPTNITLCQSCVSFLLISWPFISV